jgi:hypothetical protein
MLLMHLSNRPNAIVLFFENYIQLQESICTSKKDVFYYYGYETIREKQKFEVINNNDKRLRGIVYGFSIRIKSQILPTISILDDTTSYFF